MHFSSVLIFASCASGSLAAYTLVEDYTPENFFDKFHFFTGPDPTEGYVNYVDQATAEASGLISVENNAVYMGVDHDNVATGRGRSSVRVEGNFQFDNGLIIADIQHMPGSICGIWPAFWTFGPNWPTTGEIDIIEGASDQQANAVAFHTTENCNVEPGDFLGELTNSNCWVDAPDGDGVGCGIASNDTTSYGDGFNEVQGGVYATEISAEAVTVWWWPRSTIPEDISAGNPTPETWSTPMAKFQGACDIAEKVFTQSLTFDTTFCGSWAGDTWTDTPACASKADTCQSFVQNNPSEFEEAYWLVNSIQIFQTDNSTLSSRDVGSEFLNRRAAAHRRSGSHHGH
ncbi:hypothetical protein FQN54_006332 [Arachnomyces sp. PD_36]|nr:hypothetical protein FQN54_006332 [Arachnomyces sp. PD_36]